MMWELIRQNQIKSIYLIIGMGVILIALGYFIGAYWIEDGGIVGIIISLLIWVVLTAVSFRLGDSILLNMSGAYEVPKRLNPQLYNVVEEMAIAAGFKTMPRVFIIDDPNLNAFATSITPEKSAVAITAGLLAKLNRDELQGVIAHEISHIYNRDSQFLTFASIMLGSIQLLSEVFLRSQRYSGGSRRSRSSKSSGSVYIAIIALVLAIFGPIMARILYFAISRKREYLADASAVRLTRYPEGLASALEKITQSSQIVTANKISAPMYIANPLANTSLNLWNTHPPILERIKVLRNISSGADFASYQQAYQGVFKSNQSIIPKVALHRHEKIAIRESSNLDNNIATLYGHEINDLIRATSDFTFLNCACGLKFKIPPEYNESSITCPRCGEIRILPALFPKPIRTEGQTYHRTGTGWESVNCACGRKIQISPIFLAETIECPECSSIISVVK